MSAKRFSVKDQKLRTTKRKRKWWKIFLWTSAVVFLVLLSSYLSFESFWSVSSISISGSLNTSDSRDIESEVFSLMNKSHFGIFSGFNIVILSPNVIGNDVVKKFPRYGKVDVSRTGLTSISVHLVERNIKARVCSEECFFADETGFVFDAANISDKTVVDIFSTSTPTIGSFFTDTNTFKEILFFANESSRIGVPLKSVSLKASEIVYLFKAGGSLVVENGVGGSRVLSVLEALSKDSSVGFGTPSFMSKLDYIRIGQGNKIVFKMNDSN